MERITSVHNPRIKNIVKLEKSRERKAQNLFIVEGYRELLKAVKFDYIVKELYYCNEIDQTSESERFINELSSQSKCFEVSLEVFEKIAYRENSDGILALLMPKHKTLQDIKLSINPLLLVVESIEKPGNLGAMLRTADAADIDAIVVCDAQTDIYNPNVIRSSLGCIFTKQIAVCTTDEALAYFKSKGITTYAAALTATKYYHETSFTTPSAIIMGTEADGLSEQWLSKADFQIKIPMNGIADSLNVSTSAAILIFEAKRQRWMKK